MANSKRFAEKARTLTESQLFRIANYVPDNAEMYDDASIASIYGQIRAAQNELDRRQRMSKVRRNSSSGGRSVNVTPQSSQAGSGSRYGGHHFWDEQVPDRLARIEAYPEQIARIKKAIDMLGFARNRKFPYTEDPTNTPADLRGLADGEYAFQTSGVLGFAGDYIIANVRNEKLDYFKTLYVTEPDLVRDPQGGYTQFHPDQMVPNWLTHEKGRRGATLTIPYEAYIPEMRGSPREFTGRRSNFAGRKGVSPLQSYDRQEHAQSAIEKILAKYVAMEGRPLRWQEIQYVSTVDPTVAKGSPFTAAEIADGIRYLLDQDKVQIVCWRKLSWAPADLDPKRCTAKNCEPFFDIGPGSSFKKQAAEAKKKAGVGVANCETYEPVESGQPLLRSTPLPAPLKANPKGDALDGLRQEYGRLRSAAIKLLMRHKYIGTRDPDKLRAAFDDMVENLRRENGVEKTPEGYVMAARWALNMIKGTTLV